MLFSSQPEGYSPNNSRTETNIKVGEQAGAGIAQRESEEQFRMLANSIPQLAWMARPDGWVFWYNQRWYEYTGTTPKQMEGWGWKSVHDPAVLPKVVEGWQASIQTGEPFEMVFPLRGKDGRFRSFLTRVAPVRNAEGRVVRWLGTNTDISAQWEVEQALRESEQRFRQLAENISDVFWITELGPQLRVLYVSPAYKRLWGLQPEEIYADRGAWLSIIHPEDLAYSQEQFSKAASGQSFECDFRLCLPNGSIRWVHDRGFPVFDAEGHVRRVAGITQDVTDRKNAEAALRNSEKLAATGRLAATIAHEINNPLEAVMNLLYLLGSSRSLSEGDHRFLRMAEDELARVAHMAKQTLSFYRQTSAASDVDVAQLVDSVVGLYASRLESREVVVIRRYRTSRTVQAIPGELRQVIANLVANSIDALPNRGQLHIRVSSRSGWRDSDCGAVRITVADTGSGIPHEVQKQLFQPFFTTKKDVGTGLGLWVSRQIVEKHGGSVRVRSTPGKGTVFSIYLPQSSSKPGLRAAVADDILRAS